MINRLLDSISVVDHATIHGYPAEVCAVAEADYDVPRQEITVTLDSFLRGVDLSLPAHREKAPWLPKAEIVHEHVALDEACDLTHEIAREWRRRVRECVPHDRVAA